MAAAPSNHDRPHPLGPVSSPTGHHHRPHNSRSSLPSPTFTNPEMILPDGRGDGAHSPTLSYHPETPPSPSQYMRPAWTSDGGEDETVNGAGGGPGAAPGRRLSDDSPRSLPPSGSYSHADPTSLPSYPEHEESEATPRNSWAIDALASSPTLRDMTPTNGREHRRPEPERKWSDTSSSVHSEDLERLMWSRYEASSGRGRAAMGREMDALGDMPQSAAYDEDTESEAWGVDQEGEDGDTLTSAALSRRAEMILANAKERLLLMEGNLKGARRSLMVSPSLSLSALKSASELSNQVATAKARDRQLYRGLGVNTKAPFRPSRLATGTALTHSRVLSETIVPPPGSADVTSGAGGRQTLRSSSALGSLGGTHVPLGTAAPVLTIRTSRSQEAMRLGGGSPSSDDVAMLKASELKATRSLDPLPEDEPPSDHSRPASSTNDLREQMHQLKGRISSLRERAKEDSLRRRSLQSLRTPSPFTAAEVWYTGADGLQTNALSTDAGVGWSGETPPASATKGNGSPTLPVNQLRTKESTTTFHETEGGYQESHYEDAEDDGLGDEAGSRSKRSSTSSGRIDAMSQSEAESVYELAFTDNKAPSPSISRHEDRPDAFDYQHFFLHSSMGTYTRSDGSSSPASAGSHDSIETTRPVPEIHHHHLQPHAKHATHLQASPEILESWQLPPSPYGPRAAHQRNNSADTVASTATFATANEGRRSSLDENDDGDEPDDAAVNQAVGLGAWARSPPLASSKHRPDSAVLVRESQLPSPSSPPPTQPNGITVATAIPLTVASPKETNYHARTSISSTTSSITDQSSSNNNSPATTALLATTFMAPDSDAAERVLADLSDKDRALVLSVAACLLRTCDELRGERGRGYDARVWRRRLDGARRLLRGAEPVREVVGGGEK